MQWLQHAIGGPRECLWVDSPAAYVERVRVIRRDMGLEPRVQVTGVHQPAHVSDGRWVFDCPCGYAGLASPEWGIGICVDCGLQSPIDFPAHRETVEAILLARPSPLQRHFFPHPDTAAKRGLQAETLLGLARENRAHGVPMRPVRRRR